MLALLVTGWLFNLLLIGLAIALGVGFMVNFGYGGLDAWPARCPACGTNTLYPVKTGELRGTGQLVYCSQCGVEFREGSDGAFTKVQPS